MPTARRFLLLVLLASPLAARAESPFVEVTADPAAVPTAETSPASKVISRPSEPSRHTPKATYAGPPRTSAKSRCCSKAFTARPALR